MTSKEICIAAREAVQDLHQEILPNLESLSSNSSYAGILEDQLRSHARMQEENAARVGCGIKFRLGKNAVSFHCDNTACSLYTSVPDFKA